jgi:peroxiredoxin
MPIEPGEQAPSVQGVSLGDRAVALWFYKVDCPVCRLSVPAVGRLRGAYPDHVVPVGQDPQDALAEFARQTAFEAAGVSDPPPYAASDAYGVEVVPTLVVVDEDGRVVDVVESWDRDGYNRASLRLSELTRRPFVTVSQAGDGLPPFRPG